jgi:putative hydrolase
VDIVTHPGLSLDIDTKALAEACAQKGVALEINTSHLKSGPDFLRVAKDTGVRFAICSDAHSPERVGDLALGVRRVQEAGVPPWQIVNAR